MIVRQKNYGVLVENVPDINKSLGQFFDSALERSDEKEEAAIITELKSVGERYDQEERIAEGGMKVIYKSHDKITGRTVAKGIIKTHGDHLQLERFIEEARISSQLQHPNIMPIYDIGLNEDNHPFFTMKLIEGDNLQDILDSLNKGNDEALKFYTQDRLLDIFLKITDAIEYAHSQSIVHLDIKPANIQIGKFGEVLLCDWGLARELKNDNVPQESKKDIEPAHGGINLTLDGTIKGSPGFMAPEQIDCKIASRSRLTDIYSLGALLYSLLTLKTPIESETLEGVMQHTLTGKVIPAEERNASSPVNKSLGAVIQKCMIIQPAERYQSVCRISNEIRAYRSGFATETEKASFLMLLKLLIKRNKAVTLFILIFIASVTTLSSYFLVKVNKEKKLAIAAKVKAESSNKELISEQQRRLKASQQASDFMLTHSVHKYYSKLYGETLPSAIQSLELNPQNLSSWKHLAYLYLGSLDAPKAIHALNHLSSKENKWLMEKALLLKSLTSTDGKVSVTNALIFRAHMAEADPRQRKAISRQINYTVTHTYSLDDRLNYAKLALEVPLKRAIHFIKTGNTFALDLSSSKRTNLRTLTELINLPISKLNISYALVKDLSELENLPLVELTMENTPILSFKGLESTPLKILKFAGSKVKGLHHLPKTLEYIELNSVKMNLKALNQLPNLKKVKVPKNVYTERYLTQLKLNAEIIIEDD